jgi:hypothetical protein
MTRGSHFNRHGRRSGGNRPFKIIISAGTAQKNLPALFIQCFEQRHGDCDGRDTLFNAVCECACHNSK